MHERERVVLPVGVDAGVTGVGRGRHSGRWRRGQLRCGGLASWAGASARGGGDCAKTTLPTACAGGGGKLTAGGQGPLAFLGSRYLGGTDSVGGGGGWFGGAGGGNNAGGGCGGSWAGGGGSSNPLNLTNATGVDPPCAAAWSPAGNSSLYFTPNISAGRSLQTAAFPGRVVFVFACAGAGFHNDIAAGTCTLCPPGFFCARFATTPSPCPAGTSSAATGATSNATCVACGKGTFAPAGAAACTACSAGTYADTTNAVGCKLCPAGTFGNTSGLTTSSCSGNCSAAPGTFCQAGLTSLANTQICPVGAYCAGGSAGNVSCYPATACTVAGLAAQPPCYWNVSTLAGSGAIGAANAIGTVATFNRPSGVSVDVLGNVYVSDANNNVIRLINKGRTVTTMAGGGVTGTAAGSLNGIGTGALFNNPCGVATSPSGDVFVSDFYNNRIRLVFENQSVITYAGGVSGYVDSIGTNARFYNPSGVAVDSQGIVFVADDMNNRIRAVLTDLRVVTIAGNSAGFLDGLGTSSQFNNPHVVAVDLAGFVYVTDYLNAKIRKISPGNDVTTFAGASAGFTNGFGTAARFNLPWGVAIDSFYTLFVGDYGNNAVRLIYPNSRVVSFGGGVTGYSAGFSDGFSENALFNGPSGVATDSISIFVADTTNNRIRQAICVPCPASFYCSSGAPVLCPPGSFCPFSSVNATVCPLGTFSAVSGATSCTPCPVNTTTVSTNSTACVCAGGFFGAPPSCAPCPRGHVCPPNTLNGLRLNCGRANYCPLGSAVPLPCPLAVTPSGGWPGGVQGPAFVVETAACLNQCFFNVSVDGSIASGC